VERNPLRAGLVTRADDWQWSSLPVWLNPPLMPWLDQGPVPRHAGWLEYVQAPQTDAELAALRRSVERGTPYGRAAWVQRTAEQLGLESSLRSPGRPRGRVATELQEGGLFHEKEP
jgi:putative transposase